MCNNNIQPQVFDVLMFAAALRININALRFASGINIDLGPQQMLNTSNLRLNLILFIWHLYIIDTIIWRSHP